MKKVIFLDRDGTLNVDPGYRDYVYEKEKWRWTPGAIEGLTLLQDAGYVLAVITNQSAIGQGLYTIEDMYALHEYMQAELAKAGVRLDHIAFCPHPRPKTEDDWCDCRKPRLGMVKQIEAAIGLIDYVNSWTIGDREKDIALGKNAGTHTVLIRSRYWDEATLQTKPDVIVNSLFEAAEYIVNTGH